MESMIRTPNILEWSVNHCLILGKNKRREIVLVEIVISTISSKIYHAWLYWNLKILVAGHML